jgi:broad specificity phosphatase PhoE
MIEIHIRHGQASAETGQLTGEGEQQAIAAGQYIRDEFPRIFEYGFHSPSSRAVKTAELLSLPDTKWSPNESLSEKRADESWDQVIGRAQIITKELDNACSSSSRILVYHGDAMHAMRAHRENFVGPRFAQLFEVPYKYFNNTQLIVYADEMPEGRSAKPGTWWVKSVCPWAGGKFGHDWIEVGKSLEHVHEPQP